MIFLSIVSQTSCVRLKGTSTCYHVYFNIIQIELLNPRFLLDTRSILAVALVESNRY